MKPQPALAYHNSVNIRDKSNMCDFNDFDSTEVGVHVLNREQASLTGASSNRVAPQMESLASTCVDLPGVYDSLLQMRDPEAFLETLRFLFRKANFRDPDDAIVLKGAIHEAAARFNMAANGWEGQANEVVSQAAAVAKGKPGCSLASALAKQRQQVTTCRGQREDGKAILKRLICGWGKCQRFLRDLVSGHIGKRQGE